MSPPPALPLALGALLALSVAVGGRDLQQQPAASSPAPASPDPLANTTVPPMGASSSTTEANSYYEAATFLTDTVVASQDDCMTQCLANEDCRVWSWCPSATAGGCQVQYGNIGFRICGPADQSSNGTRSVPAGTCEFTTDSADSGFAVFSQRGDAVPFVSGLVTRVQTPPDLPDVGSGMGLDNATTAAGGSSGQCQEFHNTEWQGVLPELQLVADTSSGEDCCMHCNNTPGCQLWAVCPTVDPRCETLGASGLCFVYSMPSGGQPVVVHQGPDTPWVSGYHAAYQPQAQAPA